MFLFLDGFKVYLYVMDDIEKFIYMEFFLEIVVSIVDCILNDIKVVGLEEDKSFIIIIIMREEFINIFKEIYLFIFMRLL